MRGRRARARAFTVAGRVLKAVAQASQARNGETGDVLSTTRAQVPTGDVLTAAQWIHTGETPDPDQEA